MWTSSIEGRLIEVAGVAVTALVAYLVGTRASITAATSEREKLASQEIKDAREWWRARLDETEAELQNARVAAMAAHQRADEAEVKASDADARAAGLAYELEECRKRNRAEAAEDADALLRKLADP